MSLLFAAAPFLALYPFSIALNAAHAWLRFPVARFLLLLAWPQLGVLMIHLSGQPAPPWLVAWALLTAGFYALRLLTLRDLGRFAAALATSASALAWCLSDREPVTLALFVFALTLPAALLSLLDAALARRFGAAYSGLCCGLAGALPRLAGFLAVVVLAAVGTPPFPGFFALLDLLNHVRGAALAGVLAIWLLWAWAAARILQGFLTGSCRQEGITDLGTAGARLWAGGLMAFLAAGLVFAGGIP